jgi:hypothetical protein
MSIAIRNGRKLNLRVFGCQLDLLPLSYERLSLQRKCAECSNLALYCCEILGRPCKVARGLERDRPIRPPPSRPHRANPLRRFWTKHLFRENRREHGHSGTEKMILILIGIE